MSTNRKSKAEVIEVPKVWYYEIQPLLLQDNGSPASDGTPYDDYYQVVTNVLDDNTERLIQKALTDKVPTQWMPGRWIAPVNTGQYFFPFMERLSSNGLKFRLEMRPISQASLIWHMPKDESEQFVSLGEYWMEQANLAWVTNSTLYLLFIEGEEGGKEFDWSLIGLNVIDAKKLTKRLAEVTRLVKSVTRRKLAIKILDPHEDGKRVPLERFDGKSVVKRSALPRNIQGETHIMGRVFGRATMINDEVIEPMEVLGKGDYAVVPDEEWIHGDFDMVLHIENAKKEVTLRRDGKWRLRKAIINGKNVTLNGDLATWWPHAVLHNVKWDQQTTLIYQLVYPIEAMKADLEFKMQSINNDLAAGRFPDEEVGEVLDRDAAVNTAAMDADKANSAVARYQTFADRVKAAGISPKAFMKLIFMRINGLVTSMSTHMELNEESKMYGYHRRHDITRRNSFRATVITTDFLKWFMGIDYDLKGNDVAFDARWGAVWSGEAFEKRFDLHGGDDMDDTHEFHPVYVYGTPSTVAMLKKHGVLMPDAVIPECREDAVLMAFTTRLPNGTGEYSLNRFDWSTWPEEIPFDESIIRTVWLDFKRGKWHKPQGMVLPKSMPGLLTSRVYSKTSYTRADAHKDLLAQCSNPQFGQICNMLAFYGHITGGQVPQCMPAMLGDMVDATQQGADIVTFEQIAGMKDLIQEELDDIAGRRFLTVDKYTKARRASGLKVRAKITEDGLTAIEGPYKSAYQQLNKDIKLKYSFDMRNNDPHVQLVRRMSFTEAELNKAKEMIIKFNTEMNEMNIRSAEFTNSLLSEGSVIDGFTKKVINRFEREARFEIVDNMIEEILSSTNWVRFVLAMWHAILRPGFMDPEAKHGINDQAIVQQGSQICVGDLILEALDADGPTVVVATNHKMVNGTIAANKVVQLKIERMSNTVSEVMEAAAERVADFKFVWILANNRPLAIFRNVDGVFTKVNAVLPDFVMWSQTK